MQTVIHIFATLGVVVTVDTAVSEAAWAWNRYKAAKARRRERLRIFNQIIDREDKS